MCVVRVSNCVVVISWGLLAQQTKNIVKLINRAHAIQPHRRVQVPLHACSMNGTGGGRLGLRDVTGAGGSTKHRSAEQQMYLVKGCLLRLVGASGLPARETASGVSRVEGRCQLPRCHWILICWPSQGSSLSFLSPPVCGGR
jgi:hypothetical protein